MANRMTGKAAVVTGASSGMGKEIALAYLKEGAKVVAAARNMEALGTLEKEAEKQGWKENLRIVSCDVTKAEDCEKAVRLCADSFGTCNVLSHNAGVADNFTPVAELTDELWERMITVNLTASMKITRAALNYFLEKQISASIVMITSNAAFESATGGPAYCASKAGANALMKSIAFEYGREGIRCNAICPGPVLTNINKSMGEINTKGNAIHRATGYNAHAKEWMVKSARYALGNDPGLPAIGLPREIAPLAVYLGSDESSFVNGASIIIDGGVCLSA
ncbi:MAG: SDR family oxidoreductase [Eubacteriales bacterium]|nr:SDR family oxidoreductase [Eubacteriales bacterium]